MSEEGFVSSRHAFVRRCSDESFRGQVTDFLISTLSLSRFYQYIMREYFSTKKAAPEGKNTSLTKVDDERLERHAHAPKTIGKCSTVAKLGERR
jgi:hypothetical protein